MTGHAMQGEKNKCIESGMSDYISKPFQAQDLCGLISKWAGGNNNPEVQNNSKEIQPTSSLINLDFLREISDGNESFFKEFIQLFLNSAPQAIIDMQSCYDQKNWEALRQAAHKIKPSFNYIGLKELNQASARIEENAKNKSCFDEIPGLIDKIRTSCEIAFKELKSEIKAGLSA
jgi:HPt (histidine-containing phosphotransfer) domain-containing protein